MASGFIYKRFTIDVNEFGLGATLSICSDIITGSAAPTTVIHLSLYVTGHGLLCGRTDGRLFCGRDPASDERLLWGCCLGG